MKIIGWKKKIFGYISSWEIRIGNHCNRFIYIQRHTAYVTSSRSGLFPPYQRPSGRILLQRVPFKVYAVLASHVFPNRRLDTSKVKSREYCTFWTATLQREWVYSIITVLYEYVVVNVRACVHVHTRIFTVTV